MVVRIGTSNQVKIDAVKAAFEYYFDDVQVQGANVCSHVARQPIGQEVFRGAENRLDELKRRKDEYDYLVACEAGMISHNGHWFNLQVILVEDKDGKRGFGLSQGFEIPHQYVEKAVKTSVAEVLDGVFEGRGGIRALSKGLFTRKDLVRDGTVMALTQVLNGDVW